MSDIGIERPILLHSPAAHALERCDRHAIHTGGVANERGESLPCSLVSRHIAKV
jgi:hypothetical protein